MASHNSSSPLPYRPIYGANPVINISASQLHYLSQRETELRRSEVTNHSTITPGIILGEHLFSTTSLRNRLFVTNDTISINTSLPTDQARFNITNQKINNSFLGEYMNSQNLDAKEITDDNNIEGDGRIHSFPYCKHGPYTCPTCKKMFTTSQHFAAHVHSHYKHETLAQRKKRTMAKLSSKSKSFHLHQSKDGVTVVADPSKSNTNRVVQHKAGSIKVQAKGDMQAHDLDVPPGFEAYRNDSSSSVTIKAEPHKI